METPVPGLGYADPKFAWSYREFGAPVTLERSRATVLLVDESRTGRSDAVAPYPLLSCEFPERIAEDLDQLRDLGAITLTAVLDPLRRVPEPDDRWAVLRPFKTHLLSRLGAAALDGTDFMPSRHHRREARRARRSVEVEVQKAAEADLDEWMRLWSSIEQRKRPAGMAAASRATYAAQLALAGAVMMWARVEGQPVAAQVVLVTPDVVQVHAAVSDPRGRECRAMFALDNTLLDMFAGSTCTIHWGGVPGRTDATDGLWKYKAGWANDAAPATLLGAVLDPETYVLLGGQLPVDAAAWFPLHRDPLRTLEPSRTPTHAP